MSTSGTGLDDAIGIIGGSGFYSLLDQATEVEVETPYGRPSDVLRVGELDGVPVAFIPRHGREHQVPPGAINYRANLWALRSVGVRRVLAPCAVGSLRPELQPGTVVIPDQLVDRTSDRVNTFYDGRVRPDGLTPHVVHVPFADPYCPRGRETVVACARERDWAVTDGGTLVVIQGPRFSTRAESQWHARQGWSIVGMTGHPEAALAREIALCYTSLALVTDLDAGLELGEGVTHAEVLAAFGKNLERLRDLLLRVAQRLPKGPCSCHDVLAGVDTGIPLP